MKTFRILLEIKVDEENIEYLYPNFDILHEDIEGFVENLIVDMEQKDMERGYSVEITDGKNLLPITFSDN